MNSYGLVFGGEKTSHDSGNDITYNVVSGNDYTQVVIEGDEYILPKEAMQSDKVYDFVDKLPIEMLDEIKRSTNVFVQFPTLRQGDMVVCKNSVRNDDLHTISGTAKEIANYLQGLSACRMYAKGGYVEGGEVEDENEDSNIRFLTPMPPSKLNKTGIDSLAEIVGKDESREVMSGALYAGNKRIVATDAHILVVLENQNYPNSLKGTIKSLWNKVPQERLVGVNYPNWEVVIPQTEQYQTAELSIDDVLAYAYGGVLQGKKIIDEKDFNKYEKQQFMYVLRINIGNLEIFVDSLLLTRILRVFKANDVRRIVFHIGNSNSRPIKITTDKEHYGLIMPIMGGAEYTFLSQKIFYPISQKDFRRMTETYGNYLKEFAKMVEDRQNNQMPTEYEYLATLRPISQAHPKENLIRLEEGGYNGYGKAIYSKPLSLKQIEHFSFFPATEIKMVGTKIYYYENYVADVKTDINSIYLSKYIRNGDIELEIISPIKFLEKIQSGEYRPINEMAEGGEITMNMPLLIRVLELAKEDVKEDKEIHFIAERLQTIADKGTLTMEDYDYISGLESNEKIQKLIAENDSNDSDLRFEQEGEIEDLISRGIVDLKMYDTTPKHAKEYGLQCLNPLFIQTICVSESKRLKGLGTKVLSYIEKYAIENGHDLIFGHITQKAKFTKDKRETFFCDIDMIKNWLHSNGYAINNENNDFYKVIQSNKLEGGGSVLLAPNGKPSNLTPEQWHLVRTPEFKAWFGDWEALENAKMRDRGMDEITLNQLAKNVSKVVDENGEPLVVIHNSRANKKFSIFIDRPTYFSNLKNYNPTDGKITYECFLQIKKPYKPKDKIHRKFIDEQLEQIKRKYDGVIGKEWTYSLDVNAYVVLKSFQIKLADGTNTTFDGNNPDIRFESGGGVLLAPNGKPSNLTPEQWHLVRTPEFKAWFGDWENSPKTASKVVDENGEPKVMWHYSPNQFFVFNPNAESRWTNQRKENVVWFGGTNKVISYSEGEKGFLYECFLNAKNPIIVDAKDYDVSDYYKDENGNKTYSIQRIKGAFVSKLGEVHWSGKKNDNDGIIFKNAWDNVPLGLVVAIINPNQIKLADGSNTTFDGNNPDIRFESGGEIEMPEKDEINTEQIRAEIEALGGLLQVLEGDDRQTIQDEIEILKLALGELEYTKLLAPNGKPSNLTPQQWHLVRTPEFKAWFGDWESSPETASKVVDENGEPLVVFREIKATEKNHFNTDFQNTAISVKWQTNLDEILTRKLPSETKVGDKVRNHDKSGIVTEINNGIFKIKYEDGSESSSNAFGLTFYGEKKPKKVLSAFLNIRILGGIEKLMVHSFGTQKDSGILSISPDDKNYFTFRSNQVKLADGSNTTFDGNNPDIRFESGGEIDRGLARKKQDISFDDFHIATFANFKKIRQVDLPKREPDFVSKSGSKYWYEGDKVYRMSNHWGRIIASCNWLLDGFAVRGLSQGYCKLKDFHREMSFLLNDKNVGKRFLVGKTSFLRSGKGAIDISENEGVFIKETSDFYVFDTFKVSKITLAYVKPLQKVNYE